MARIVEKVVDVLPLIPFHAITWMEPASANQDIRERLVQIVSVWSLSGLVSISLQVSE